ncbi:MAG: glycosyl hydrolase family 18 protein [Chloroflexota bacterium]
MSLSIPIHHTRKRRAPLLLAPLTILVLALAASVYLHLRYPTASPVTSATYLVQNAGHAHAKLDKQVVGFLPYWRLDDSRYMRSDLLSEVIYFSLSVDQNGQLVKTVNGQQEPGWRWWSSAAVRNQIAKTQIAGDRFLLSVAMQNQKQVESFLSLGGAQQTLIDNLLDQVKSNRLDGLNLDVELDGKTTDQDRAAFTSFATKLAAAFHQQAPGAELSIDLPPLAARTPGLYDVPALTPLFDRIIVMSYDYYASTSDVAGPVAPMSGFADHQYFFDVDTTYADYIKAVPKDKLVMGVPYYGYDWPVKDASKPLAPTTGEADILSFSRMKTDTDLKPQDCHWDIVAQETWCSYTDSKTNTQREAWFEDQRSVSAKYDFAKTQGLGGVAIWTLGYDGAYPELWGLIKDKFTS